MVIYCLLALCVLFLDWFESRSKKKSKIYWYSACILIILIIGLRDESVGSDTIVYVHTFQNCQLMKWSEILEMTYRDPGFYIFTKMLTYICFGQSIIYLLFMSFLSCIGIFYLIYRNSSRPILSLYFWICLTTFNFVQTGMRQSIAMSLCAFSIQFIDKKKIYWFIGCVILAATIHHSALLFLPVYLTSYVNANKKYILLFVILFMILSHYTYEWIFMFGNYGLIYNYEFEGIDNGMVYFCILIIISILAFFTKEKWMKTNELQVVYLMSLYLLIFWNLRLIDRMAERPSMYFMCVLPIILVNSLNSNYFVKQSINDTVKYISIILSLILLIKRNFDVTYLFNRMLFM